MISFNFELNAIGNMKSNELYQQHYSHNVKKMFRFSISNVPSQDSFHTFFIKMGNKIDRFRNETNPFF